MLKHNSRVRAISEILDLKGDIKITHIRRGSIKITIELPPDKAEELLWIIRSGQLEDHRAVSAELKEYQEEQIAHRNEEQIIAEKLADHKTRYNLS